MLRFAVIIIVLTPLLINAQGFKKYSFGSGLQFKNDKHNFNLSGRVQALAEADFDLDSNFKYQSSDLFVRRARLKFKSSHYDGLIKTKFEFGFSKRDLSVPDQIHYTFLDRMVLDAYVIISPFKNFGILIGQHKLPGNRQRVVSSANMELVDRSILNSRMTLDRDFGIQINYKWSVNNFLVRHNFALSQGEGKNIILGNRGGLNYTFRTEFLPFGQFNNKGDYTESDLFREDEVKLSIGVSYDFNDDVYRDRGQKGRLLTLNTELGLQSLDIHTAFLDAMLKYKGFSFLGEYGYRAWRSQSLSNCYASSVNLQPSYTFKSNWNIAFRYAYYHQEIAGKSSWFNEVRLGVSKYIIDHKLKIQSDIGLEKTNTRQYMVGRIQVEFHL